MDYKERIKELRDTLNAFNGSIKSRPHIGQIIAVLDCGFSIYSVCG